MAPKRPGPKVDDASQKAFDMMMSGKSLREALDKTGLPETAGNAIRKRFLGTKTNSPAIRGHRLRLGPPSRRRSQVREQQRCNLWVKASLEQEQGKTPYRQAKSVLPDTRNARAERMLSKRHQPSACSCENTVCNPMTNASPD